MRILSGMNTYLVFLRNMATRQDFVAPYAANSAAAAEEAALQDYPTGQFMLLTIYAEAELQAIMANLRRWPGVPSNVEAAKGKTAGRPVAQVRASIGGLPPLHKPQPQPLQFLPEQRPTGAVVQGPAGAEPAWAHMAAPSKASAGGLTLAEAMAALRGEKPKVNSYGGKQEQPKKESIGQTTPQAASAKPQSVIDVLRSLRS